MKNGSRGGGHRVCRSWCGGFTLHEVLVVLAILALLAIIAVPPLQDLARGVESRKAARDIASVLRMGRARAIATNYEHRVEFDGKNKRYRLTQGNRANGSHSWDVVIQDWTTPEGVTVDIDANISSIQFNTNGSSNHGTITIRENMYDRIYKIVISRTGRVRIS
jgi:type II secretion system protein H